jgi:hypothetical protein
MRNPWAREYGRTPDRYIWDTTKGEEIDYFVPGELGRVYSAWPALRYEDGRISCSQDRVPHFHSVERIVVTPPPSAAS